MMRTLLLLCVIFCCLSVSVAGDSSTSLPEENGVLLLKKDNFNRALKQNKQLLVHFFAPLSGDSQRLALAFRGAAEQLIGSEVKLGVVDVSKETNLTKELNATTPPPLRLYLSGDRHNPVPCPVFQSSASIVTWLKRRAGPSADIITDLNQSDRLVASEELVVLGLFKDVERGRVEVFYAAAVDLPDLPFSVTRDQDIFRKYDITQDSVLLVRQSTPVQVLKVTSQMTKEDLISFITVHQLELVTEYNGQTASRILSSPVLNHAILFVNKTDERFQTVYSDFQAAAAPYRGKVLFVMVDVDEPRNGRMLEYFRVRESEAPMVRLVNLTSHVTYHLPSDTLDTPTIIAFCKTYLDGTAQPKMQSEALPADWDQKPVIQLVGENLERLAFNPDKTAFIMFYLPYSEESRSLFPLWEELALHFLDREEVVIARIDASANDFNLSMRERYPALRLFPALHAERVVAYSGQRNLKDLVQFLEKEMERAKMDRAQVAVANENLFSTSLPGEIKVFSTSLPGEIKEEEDRRKYIETQKAIEAKEAKEAKEEKQEL
ncbi:protein disulfide-isomerase isoform X1 [Oncorhynchus kisutch]|uniref:protein disulfide-isomerase isoform X1 n=1 Tax=Oncorhynchus kisutch TaxID=8019 RepID=UPI0012DECD28|nr:protein disulfide-isomerase-like isoform X1 [Oncorhynchus kisutch]XP_031667093.1 protein disulfide-isomerase-like isoform X1 [Oncorhynchus kisutch]